MQEDLEELRQKAIEMGWFKVNPWFYVAHLGHIIGLEMFTVWLLSQYGVNCWTFIVALICMTTAQAI